MRPVQHYYKKQLDVRNFIFISFIIFLCSMLFFAGLIFVVNAFEGLLYGLLGITMIVAGIKGIIQALHRRASFS